MTADQERAKDIEEKGLQRRTLVEHFQRTWKSTLVEPLKDSHADYVVIHEALRDRIKAGITMEEGPLSKEWTDTIASLERLEKCIASTEERMMQLLLHPTRPKANQPARAGAGRKPGDTAEPVEAVEVSMPRPEVDVPRGTKE